MYISMWKKATKVKYIALLNKHIGKAHTGLDTHIWMLYCILQANGSEYNSI